MTTKTENTSNNLKKQHLLKSPSNSSLSSSSENENAENIENPLENPTENPTEAPIQKQKQKKPKGFNLFHLSPQIISGIKFLGYHHPTPIQKKIIPEIISGFNIIAHSRTGSGKTAAFLIPILSKLSTHSKIIGARCLILSPVRDLAFQTFNFCKKLGKFTDLRYAIIAGGKGFDSQFEKLAQNPDIIIATPGRVLHHLEEGSLQLKKIEIIVIDECDKMMELSLGEQLKNILKNCPFNKQIILISATIQDQLATFLKSGVIKEYKIIGIDEENMIPEKLKIHLIYMRKNDKLYALISLLKTKKIIDIEKQLTIIFVMTKYHCDYLQEILKYWNIESLIIYGSMEQDLRNSFLESFKKGKIKILIVTDVAARGIDIPLLDNVINFDFPKSKKLFIHRVGRTARAGRSGKVFNLINSDDLPYFFDIQNYLGKKIIFGENENNLNDENSIDNYNEISFGSIPDQEIISIKNDKISYLFDSKLDIDELYKSMIRAEKKGNTFNKKPSSYGIKKAKELLNEFDIKIHPFYLKKYGDEEKQHFLNDLKHYKPKELYFEKVNESTVDEKVLKEFKNKVDIFHKKKEYEKELETLKDKDKEIKQIEDDKIFDEEQKIITENSNKIKELKLLGKKVKRSKIRNFKNENQYISDQKDENSNKNLWGGEKPLELEELTMNINADDTYERVKKTVWNNKKKTFKTEIYDSLGNKIKNESGQIMKKSDKYHPYKEWKKKTKLAIQKIGEVENENNIKGVREKIMEKKEGKSNKSTLKSFEEILKGKKKMFKENQKKKKLFSKKKFKENQIREKQHLNSKTQTFIKNRSTSKGKSKGKSRGKSKGKRK